MTEAKKPGLSTARPSRGAQQPTAAHVEKALQAVSSASSTASEEKQLKVLAAPKYHKGMSELKNCSADQVPVKNFLLEAIEDLFEKYSAGEGRFKIDNVPELRRRLDSLMK